jgi:hypothetical protein
MISPSFAGSSGFKRAAGIGARLSSASKITAVLSPRNGSVPVAISYNTVPNEKMSERASSSRARACSGDMYATVPSVLPGLVRCSGETPKSSVTEISADAAVSVFANPKSSIFTTPRLVMKMFAGLMSR